MTPLEDSVHAVTFAEETAGDLVEAALDFDPDSLNLKSKGRYVTCCLGLPDGYDVADIDVGSLVIEDGGDGIPALRSAIDADTLIVKFSRRTLIAALKASDLVLPAAVDIVVSGVLIDGTCLTGIDTIVVVKPGK